MKILAIDIGAGTQDILFYNSKKELENSIKLVLPSPSVIIVDKIKEETDKKHDIYFDGVIMGGGKIKNALITHMEKGYKVAMEKEAALTIKDDLNAVANLGIEIVKDDGYQKDSKYKDYSKITLKDIDIHELSLTIAKFDLNFDFDEIAVAVQDHGVSAQMGNREFRFEKIRQRLSEPLAIEKLAFNGNVPDYFSRMKSIEKTLDGLHPTLMDSKFASIYGACYDPEIRGLKSFVVMDIGNGHMMAASIENGKIQGVFEHHTANLTPEKIEKLIQRLVDGVITHKEVHDNHGHGAHIINPISKLEKVVITGPRRKIIEQTNLDFYNASPGGDVMMTGTVGLIKAVEHLKKKKK